MAFRRYLLPFALTGMVALAAAGCGGDDDDVSSGGQSSGGDHSGHGGDATKAPSGSATDAGAKTVAIEMTDELVYKPGNLDVGGGEKIRFVFTNVGKLPHDALIGDAHVQDEHEAGAKEGEGHGSHHHGGEPPPFVTVNPGETKEVEYKFTTPGEVIIGCHQNGHYAAGMKLSITVA